MPRVRTVVLVASMCSAILLSNSLLGVLSDVESFLPPSSSVFVPEMKTSAMAVSNRNTAATSFASTPEAIYAPPNPIIRLKMSRLPRPDHPFLIASTFLTDDFSIGKSCQRDEGGEWECRDCQSGNHTDWFKCAVVEPRGECKAIRAGKGGWDPSHSPRQASLHDPLDSVEAHRHVMTHYGLNDTYEQIPCESFEHCWDMSRCVSRELTVYGYGVTAQAMSQRASMLYPEAIQYTEHPDEACLFLVAHDSFTTPSEMRNESSWNAGRNHFLWNADQYFDNHHDRPFNTQTNFDHASVASAAFMDANIRLGYDIPTSTMKMTAPEFFQPQIPNLTLGRRPILVSFKGGFFHSFPMVQPWWQHRYLAFEYWEQAPDVFIDVKCARRRIGKNKWPQKRYVSSVYAELLLNSTFAFCPGGGSVGSYRFTEALSLGAIPVVTSDLVPPLAPEVDWRGCLVRVSEARIADIPRILRAKSDEEIRARQARCRHLFHAIWGWTDDNDGGYRLDPISRILPLALRIWSHRIHSYRAMREQGEAILSQQQALI